MNALTPQIPSPTRMRKLPSPTRRRKLPSPTHNLSHMQLPNLTCELLSPMQNLLSPMRQLQKLMHKLRNFSPKQQARVAVPPNRSNDYYPATPYSIS